MRRHYTPISLVAAPSPIRYADGLVALGSCFAQNMSQRLDRLGYSVCSNPFGPLYNPLSLADALTLLLDDTLLSDSDLVQRNGQWMHWLFHHDQAGDSPAAVLDQLNQRLTEARHQLAQARYLLLTWGTAWVYRLATTGTVVGNCHRFPTATFRRERLTVGAILAVWQPLFQRLREQWPDLQVIGSISPIRHLKDGLVDNQISKATLVLALHALVEAHAEHCHYFPAYELLLDDLRDYRYYADDLAHPSALAVSYIWDTFEQYWLSQAEAPLRQTMEQLRQALEHRPRQPQSNAYQQFAQQQLQRIAQLEGQLPATAVLALHQAWQQRLKSLSL